MFDFLQSWYRRYFTDPQAALLAVLLVISFIVVFTMGKMLAPLLAAIIIAYLLEGAVQKLEKRIATRIVSVSIIFFLFITFMGLLLFVLMPILWSQLTQFFQEVPNMINKGQGLLSQLPQKYPEFISEQSVSDVMNEIRGGLTEIGQNVLSISVASIPAIITVLVYLILVPLMIFFFLKDKHVIMLWMSRFLPTERHLVTAIWYEMDAQIGNYVRGKFNEILIVGITSFIVFLHMGLNYAPLLAIIVGLSVLIPYIGAAVVTLPVAFVGYIQWGLESSFYWLMVWYFVLQFLDGNVLVPLLFSDAVNLHPVAIIVAILVFGGLWGFWGVFFAIPLATLVKALINIWPTTGQETVTGSQVSANNSGA